MHTHSPPHPQANQYTVAIAATARTQQLVDVTVRGNFELMGGQKDPGAQSAAVLFRGAAPKLTRTSVTYQASVTAWRVGVDGHGVGRECCFVGEAGACNSPVGWVPQ